MKLGYLVFGLSVLLATSVASAETIVLENGRRFTGKIVSHKKGELRLRVPNGTRTFFTKDIGGILTDEADDDEATGEKITSEAFRASFTKLPRDDADAYVALGQQASDSGLPVHARQAFRAAVRADPDHAEARQLLGYVKFAGHWTTADAVLRERGLVQRGGRWVPVDSAVEEVVEPVAKPKEAKKKEEKKSDDPNAWYDDHTTVSEWDKAALYKSKRYVISSNIKPEYVKRYGKMMDRYFDRFLSVFRNVMVKGTKYTRGLITIYPAKEAFHKTEKLPQTVGGYYRPKDRRVVTYHGRFGPTGTTRTVLAHEGTHQFQHLVLGNGFMNCPIWLIEGLAVLFEAADWNPKLNKIDLGKIPRDRLEIMKRAVKEKKTIPLADLFRVQQRQFTGFHYAHAWAMIYRLIYGEKSAKKRKTNGEILSKLLVAGRRKRVRYRDVLGAFGGESGLAKFEEEWKQWITDVDFDYKP